jgi:hypothetical protein
MALLARSLGRIAHCALLACALGACTTGTGGSFWGADATMAPGWQRLGRAAATAAADPFTWAPAVAAAALQIGDADNDLADWANEETPIFGSRETASDASDWLRAASLAAYVGTGLGAPAPSDGWLSAKAKGFAVGAAAMGTTIGLTDLFKEVSDRERPLGQDDNSFPSGHASLTGVSARLTSENLRYYDMPRGAHIAANAGLSGLPWQLPGRGSKPANTILPMRSQVRRWATSLPFSRPRLSWATIWASQRPSTPPLIGTA